MKPSAEGGHQTPSNDRSVTRQEVSLEKKEKELSSGSFNNLSDRGPRRPDQIRRDTYKHKPAAGYEPGILSSDISSEGCEVSATGGGRGVAHRAFFSFLGFHPCVNGYCAMFRVYVSSYFGTILFDDHFSNSILDWPLHSDNASINLTVQD